MRPRRVILCVCADEITLSTRRFMLELAGFRIVGVTSGAEALLKLSHRIELLMTDLDLPDMDGNELVKQVKVYMPELPALIVSDLAINYDRASAANRFIAASELSAATLVEWSRRLTARKRGPKPGTRIGTRPLAA